MFEIFDSEGTIRELNQPTFPGYGFTSRASTTPKSPTLPLLGIFCKCFTLPRVGEQFTPTPVSSVFDLKLSYRYRTRMPKLDTIFPPVFFFLGMFVSDGR